MTETMNVTLHVEAEETLTVSQYSLGEPHAVIVLGKDGSLAITVAGGGAEISEAQMLAWFKHTVGLLNKGLNPAG